MAWNVPATAVAGSILAAAFWNAQVRDNLALLKTSISDDGTTWQGKLRALLTEQTITATGTQHDVSVGVGVTYLRCNNASALTITGFSIGGATPAATACVILDAVGADAVTIAHQNAGSTAAYRVIAPDAADLVVPVGGRTMLLYDGTTGRWRAVFGGAQSNEFDDGLLTDTISELTAAAGVTIDGVVLKDGGGTFANHVLPDSTANNRALGLTGQRFSDAWLSGYLYDRARTVGAGVWTAVPHSAGDFTANGSMTWTVEAGDLFEFSYAMFGDLMVVSFVIFGSTIGGTPNTLLNVKIPAGKLAARGQNQPMSYSNNGGTEVHGVAQVAAAGTVISLYRGLGVGNWATGTNNNLVRCVFPIAIQP